MAYFYVGGDRDQMFLLPVSMRDWVDERHLVWFVIDVVAKVDMSAFHRRHPNDGPGRPAYHPEMMLALLFYAYMTGVRSSRRIEAACHTDAVYRLITGNVTPDHATIARFLVDHQEAIEKVFIDVLRLCAAAGLVSVGMIAIDGTKMSADASLQANRGAEWIRREVKRILDEAIATDIAEDAQPELFEGEQLPEHLSSPKGRQARLEGALAQIEAEDAAEREQLEKDAAKARRQAEQGRRLLGRKPADPHAALIRAEADVQAVRTRLETAVAERAEQRAKVEAQAAAEGRNLRGPTPNDGLRPREQRQLERAEQQLSQAQAVAAITADRPERKTNITDPDSRIMKDRRGWIQGYNAQAAVNEHQIVIACTVSQDATDVGLYQPMVNTTRQILETVGVTEPIQIVLADAGYWSEDNATADGPDRLIATLKDWKQRRAARELGTTTGPPPDDATPLEAMEHRLRTPEGAQTYARRSQTVEPVFGDNKENRGYRRFRRRGLAAVRSEWALINLSHNIAKLYEHHISTNPAPT